MASLNGHGEDPSGKRKRKNPSDVADDYFEAQQSDVGKITVITATGRTIPVTVKGSDTIDIMKLKIQHVKAHTPIDQHERLFRQKVPEYTNNNLANRPINKDSTRESIGFMDIFIKNLEGKITHSLEVKPSDTIGNMKANLCCGVLMFNDVVVDDNSTLADFHIVNGSILTGIDKVVGKMEIFVNNTITRNAISVLVTPKDTITNVKQEICVEEKCDSMRKNLDYRDKEYVPFDEQVLIFNGMALEDSGTVSDFNIKAKSTLMLMRRSRRLMQIFIKTFRERRVTLEVNPSYTIGKVKSKIQDMIHIPHDEQELIFNETVLDNFDTIADSDINDQSTLTLVRRSTGHMHIIIEKPSGTINMKVKPSDTVYKVISKVGDMEGIPCSLLRLMFDGRCLRDDLTLADYQIHDKSTIDVMLFQRA